MLLQKLNEVSMPIRSPVQEPIFLIISIYFSSGGMELMEIHVGIKKSKFSSLQSGIQSNFFYRITFKEAIRDI